MQGKGTSRSSACRTEGGGFSTPSRPSNGQSSYVVSSFNEEDSEEGEVHNFTPAFGTNCLDMCPAAERARRERLKDLAIYEKLNDDPRKTSATLAVKNYIHTKWYMALCLIELRSIRQDITLQNIKNGDAIHMYEDMVKFYVLSHNKLAKCTNSTNIMSLLCLNKEQLLSFTLGVNRQTMGESITSWLRQLQPLVFKSKELNFAPSILRYLQAGNYVGFFRTIAAETSNLHFCLIEPYINEDLMQGLITNINETHICHGLAGQVQALSFINHSGYEPHPYLLARLSAILMMQYLFHPLVHHLSLLKLNILLEIVSKEKSVFRPETDEAGVKVLPTEQTSFRRPSEGFRRYSFSGSERQSTRFSDL
ncbi:hypothetical protein H6P81_003025 [Aristolochia fimbriata]|uniref:SAC3/GANP/THP3 conserved domain-containing protein n=1 Tax=Aristolochia fimbriata TaxID=158543 RepID=A0AAV7FEN7_ARIFI|nr:hypothetical protein H6P81_003025 [Aristolochia fimbriata]